MRWKTTIIFVQVKPVFYYSRLTFKLLIILFFKGSFIFLENQGVVISTKGYSISSFPSFIQLREIFHFPLYSHPNTPKEIIGAFLKKSGSFIKF